MNPAHDLDPGRDQRASWRSPLTFTALVPLAAFKEAELRELLRRLAPDLREIVAGIPDLHSFRLVVVPASTPGVNALHLLLNAVHDRPLDPFLRDLAVRTAALLRPIWSDAGFSADPLELPRDWMRFRIGENTLHLGAIGRTVEEISAEKNLREEIGNFADQVLAEGRWTAETPAEKIRMEIRAHILSRNGAGGLPTAATPRLSAAARFWRFLDLVKTFCFPAIGVLSVDISNAITRVTNRRRRWLARMGYGLWWIYGLIPTLLAYLSVRVLEIFERDDEAPPADAAKVARLEAEEDQGLMNEVTYWFPVRDSIVRRILLAIVLWGSERGCRHFWTDGRLSGIDTIHYARILQIARCRAMLFMSDYDGSLNRYLGDFMGAGSRAIIPISSNVAGCPKTRWLFGTADAATFGPRLVRLLRTYQLETSIWYNAYPLLSVQDVLINAAIRDGLFVETMDEAQSSRWAEMI